MKLGKLPEKEELEYKEKELLLNLYEQFASSAKVWFIFLGVLVVVAFPAKIILQQLLTRTLIARYQPPPVNRQPYTPQDVKIIKTKILPVVSGTVSAYAQILNPNPDIAAASFDYKFVFKDRSGLTLKEVAGNSYLLAGESKFLLISTVNFFPNQTPTSATLVLDNLRWTKRKPEFEVKLETLQENTGVTPEGKFFAEGAVRNPQGFQIKRVDVGVVLFDKSRQEPVAVNSTVLTDLIPAESRYFRVVWPTSKPFVYGQLQVLPSVNLFEPGLILKRGERIPER